MRLSLAFLLLPAAVFGGVVAETPAGRTASPVPGVILLGTGFGAPSPLLTLSPASLAPQLIKPDAPKLILPESKPIVAAPSLITVAARPMTEEELNPAKPLTGDALARLADSLAGGDEKKSSDERPAALGAAFDGSVAPKNDEARAQAAAFFAAPAEGPELPAIARTARRLFARLLPAFERPVNSKVRFDESRRPVTGHTWTKEEGHAIELVPEPADARGEVVSAFGIPGMTRVQRKIERLMIIAHERAHVVFDDVVGRRDQHAGDSAYSAMTEGFAVTLERLFIDRVMADPLGWGIGPRDAADLLAIKGAREQWLAAFDTHYSEGVVPWRAAQARGGDEGILAFLARLSASRMTEVKRDDPAYQLAAHHPDLLAAYLGRDAEHPMRRGLEAYAKAAAGNELTPAEADAARAAIEKAGPDGRARVFERTLRVDRAVGEDGPPSVERAFALARLSPAGASELAAYLAENAAGGGLDRIIGSRGPGPRLNAVVAGAEKLPFTEAGRVSWMASLMDWLTKLV